MLQQVNLYDRLPKIQAGWPDAAFIIRSAMGLFVFLIFLHFVHKWQLSNIDEHLQKTNAEQVGLTNELTDLTRRYPLASQEGGIEKIMQTIPLQISEKQKILTELSNSAKFSLYLEGLAETAVNGTWLTEIVFGRGGRDLTLKGQAQNPDLVNQLMKNIVDNDIFNGKQFRIFNISQPKSVNKSVNKTYVEFYMSTLSYSDENQATSATSDESTPQPSNNGDVVAPPVDSNAAKIPPATVQEPSSSTTQTPGSS